jgi:hypothetical protein
MRFVTISGENIIDQDEEVVALAEGINLDHVDVSHLLPYIDVLGQVYIKALSKKTPKSAAEYVKLKKKVLEHIH